MGILQIRRHTQVILLGFVALFATVFARVEDSVSIRYLPGYPLPNQSSEWLDIRIKRISPPIEAEEREIDRFFSLVAATLAEYGVIRDWQIVIPDAPSIEITVDLNGRRMRLASAHVVLERTGNWIVTERGVEALNQRTHDAVLSQQSEEYRRHRLAFEKLLSLVLERVRTRLSP